MRLEDRIMEVAIHAKRDDMLREIHYFNADECGSQVEAMRQARALLDFCKAQKGIQRATRKGTTVYIKYGAKV